jgi:hypothetical protein
VKICNLDLCAKALGGFIRFAHNYRDYTKIKEKYKLESGISYEKIKDLHT